MREQTVAQSVQQPLPRQVRAQPEYEGTVTRADLAEAVQARVGFSYRDSARLVNDILDAISGALARGEPVKLRTFGSFDFALTPPRRCVDLHRRVPITIPPRRVVVFRPAGALCSYINERSK